MDTRIKLSERRKALGLTLAEVAAKVGVSEATVSRWESGQIDNMKRDKIALLAGALEVSPLFVMGMDEKDVPAKQTPAQGPPATLPPLTDKDERDIQKKLAAIIDGLHPESGLAFYNAEQPLTEEDKELLRISLENSLRLARQMAKQKFTPKKHRKE